MEKYFAEKEADFYTVVTSGMLSNRRKEKKMGFTPPHCFTNSFFMFAHGRVWKGNGIGWVGRERKKRDEFLYKLLHVFWDGLEGI